MSQNTAYEAFTASTEIAISLMRRTADAGIMADQFAATTGLHYLKRAPVRQRRTV